jgi:hypothetical protein
MLSFITILLLILPELAVQKGSVQENTHVRSEIRLASTTMTRGGTGEIILYLRPNEGIHINTNPAMEFEFEKQSSVHFLSITSLPTNAKTGYLNAEQPIKYSFTLDKNISKGKHSIRGIVRYFFCSDAEGWCNRFVQPIDLRYTVTR